MSSQDFASLGFSTQTIEHIIAYLKIIKDPIGLLAQGTFAGDFFFNFFLTFAAGSFRSDQKAPVTGILPT